MHCQELGSGCPCIRIQAAKSLKYLILNPLATVSEFRKLLNTFTLWSSKLGLLWAREGWWQGFQDKSHCPEVLMARRVEMGWRSGGPHAVSDNASQQSCLRPENQHHGKRPTAAPFSVALHLHCSLRGKGCLTLRYKEPAYF